MSTKLVRFILFAITLGLFNSPSIFAITYADFSVYVQGSSFSAFNLRADDRKISGTEFIVSNWKGKDLEGLVPLFGLIGVVAMSTLNDAYLESDFEATLKREFDLKKILNEELHKNAYFSEHSKSISLKETAQYNALYIEPTCYIHVTKFGNYFFPQISVRFFDGSGERAWEKIFIADTKMKPLKEGEPLWTKEQLELFFSTTFTEMLQKLSDKLQGKEEKIEVKGLDLNFEFGEDTLDELLENSSN